MRRLVTLLLACAIVSSCNDASTDTDDNAAPDPEPGYDTAPEQTGLPPELEVAAPLASSVQPWTEVKSLPVEFRGRFGPQGCVLTFIEVSADETKMHWVGDPPKVLRTFKRIFVSGDRFLIDGSPDSITVQEISPRGGLVTLKNWFADPRLGDAPIGGENPRCPPGAAPEVIGTSDNAMAAAKAAEEVVDALDASIEGREGVRDRQSTRGAVAPRDPLGPREITVLRNSLAHIAQDYPAQAVRQGLQGRVGIEALVGPNGRAISCSIYKSSGHAILDEAACAGVQRRGRFEPALDSNGEPVEAVFRTEIQYSLHGV